MRVVMVVMVVMVVCLVRMRTRKGLSAKLQFSNHSNNTTPNIQHNMPNPKPKPNRNILANPKAKQAKQAKQANQLA